MFLTDPTPENLGGEGVKAEVPNKCIQCRVLDYEHSASISFLLSEIARLKGIYEALQNAGQHDRVWEKQNVENGIANLQQWLAVAEFEMDILIQEARF